MEAAAEQTNNDIGDGEIIRRKMIAASALLVVPACECSTLQIDG